MSGATRVVMPKIGLTMETAEIGSWIKAIGDHVEVGDPLVEFSTEKVASEIEAPIAGILTEQLVATGDEVAVGHEVAVIEVRED